MKTRIWQLIITFSILWVNLPGQIKMPSIFGDNLVLQQKTKAAIWGWAEPGEEIGVNGSWQDKTVSAKTGDDGKWMVKLVTPEAGGPFTINISGGETLSFGNVMIGEVWLCSGHVERI